MGTRTDNLTASAYGRLLEGLLAQAGAYALSILRNRADADDAVQLAALHGLERLSTYDPQRPFKGWWFTVLRNCCMDLLRSRRRRRESDLVPESAAPSRGTGRWEDLAEALDGLEPQQAEILRLKYFGGLSYDELSNALQIPKGTVMSRLHYARKALALQMTEPR